MHTSLDRNSTMKTAGLGAALAFLATEAAAAVQYVDNPDVTYACYGNISASFNPITGASNSSGSTSQQAIGLGLSGCFGPTVFQFGSIAGPTPGTITSVGFLNTPVSAGTLIDGSTGSWVDGTTPNSQVTSANFSAYTNNAHALVAYRFKTDVDANLYLYGWAEFSANSQSLSTVGLYSFAYEDSGAGIVAGSTSAIPEPGVTAAIFGLAAVAIVGFRRLRQRAVRA